MSYNNRIYNIALGLLEEKREKNKLLHQKRKDEIISKIPEYISLKNDNLTLLESFMKNSAKIDSGNLDLIKDKIRKNEEKKRNMLKRNGFSEDYLDDVYDCYKCKDTGFILNKKCECFEKILKDVSKKESNLSYMLDEQNFNNFCLDYFSDEIFENGLSAKDNMKNILSYVNTFIESFEDKNTKSLLFTGSTGVGKTFLSSCIAKTLLDSGKNVLYQSSAKLCEILEEHKFNRENAIYDTKNIIRDLYDIDLIIIDDFGTEFKTSYTLTALYELINSRLINNKKIIISTNLSVLELKEIYSERLFSRFLGEFLILEFTGNDLRTQKILEK